MTLVYDGVCTGCGKAILRKDKGTTVNNNGRWHMACFDAAYHGGKANEVEKANEKANEKAQKTAEKANEVEKANEKANGEKILKPGRAKVQLDLIPVEPMGGVAKAMEEGANKYDRNNWRVGDDHSVQLAATLRHLNAYAMRQDADPDSGLHPLDHALASLLILRTWILVDSGTDDRPHSDRP